MLRLSNRTLAGLLAVIAGLTGCDTAPAAPSAPPSPPVPAERLGLMTSLPIYWPLGTEIADLAAGVPATWQKAALAPDWELYPLDTLSPVPGLSPDAPEVDPLAGLTRIAVIQPRGLSPADNVGLDGWVRAGGRLLLVLDPALTGEYDLPLGDPRRPVDAALVPPVVARWGMAISFDEAQAATARTARLDTAPLPLVLAGQIAIADPAAADCTLLADGAAARCAVEKGQVTLIADAAVFEHDELAGESGATLRGVVAAALP